ncbi:molybdate ABC transporter substrate-binding protein [Marimonas lutisalis]|uniref:molybdate ABC transporter substrate-binding protein n=1 Tax=Marimonas lutisalis TaxID=2545756 RepID=UPI0010FA14CC|nr:molybdate ABC transporter substrate-binding protein [Marimonas lutisalis]
MKVLCHTLLALVLLTGAALADAPARVTVFAAASLRDALDAVAESYDGARIVASYGGSAAMARQVAQGAPADLVILANPQWMDWLEGQGVLMPDSRRDLLGNRLVLIGPAGAAPLDASEQAMLARLGDGRLALGQVNAVPAGIYARAWLESAGLWPALAPHLAETENVRAALALVSRGEAPLGVVYASDAQADPGVSVLYDIPADSHPPITYPAAQVSDSPAAAALLAYLSGPQAAVIFAAHGFTPLGVAQ